MAKLAVLRWLLCAATQHANDNGSGARVPSTSLVELEPIFRFAMDSQVAVVYAGHPVGGLHSGCIALMIGRPTAPASPPSLSPSSNLSLLCFVE